MDVLQIATRKAASLHRLQNWGNYSTFDCSYDPRTRLSKLDEESLEHIRLETMAEKLAMCRARETHRDFQTTLAEVKLEVAVELARILARNLDPGFAATEAVAIGGEGEVCAVCQEVMERGEEVREMVGCRHRFHCFCIVKWLDGKNTCPLCRFQMQRREFRF